MKKKDKKKGKKRKPDATTYRGKKAASEKETKALISFVKRISPKTVLNLHSTGSILYWDFDVSSPLHEKQYRLASEIKKRNCECYGRNRDSAMPFAALSV